MDCFEKINWNSKCCRPDPGCASFPFYISVYKKIITLHNVFLPYVRGTMLSISISKVSKSVRHVCIGIIGWSGPWSDLGAVNQISFLMPAGLRIEWNSIKSFI